MVGRTGKDDTIQATVSLDTEENYCHFVPSEYYQKTDVNMKLLITN